ncbi:MAG: Rieske 2Fe-2S domain-containing protein [Actinobacteria bacterium]|nr:Rieske 2Fe-2S domain-containing protein [Actinomycetota bacterium]
MSAATGNDEQAIGVLLTDDPLVVRQLGTVLAGGRHPIDWVGYGVATARGRDPLVVVVDLGRADGIELATSVRRQWPRALVAGFLALPDQALWLSGQRAGCDLVVNRGALARRLRELLGSPDGLSRRTFPLLAANDTAGRLGFVAAVPDTPVGPVAVYQIEGQLYAAADRCPHAGATLSAGVLDHTTVTCPRHGSQFDVCSGQRLRGPADDDIAVYPVVVEGGQVLLVLGQSVDREG